ncbi:hypothetical protein ES703_39001 [subsurface metagenome]
MPHALLNVTTIKKLALWSQFPTNKNVYIAEFPSESQLADE